MRTYPSEMIKAQIEAETKMQETGATNYIKNQEALEASGNGANTDAVTVAIKRSINPIVEAVSEYLNKTFRGKPGLGAASVELLSTIKDSKGNLDVNRIALSSLVTVFDLVTSRDSVSRQTLYHTIGKALEDEARWTTAYEQASSWTEWKVKQFKKEHKSYVNSRTSMKYSMNKYAQNEGLCIFEDWSYDNKIGIGMIMYELINSTTGFFEEHSQTFANKTTVTITVSEETKEFIKAFKEKVSADCAAYRPMFTEPKPWTAFDDGGYLSINLPFVKKDCYSDVNGIDFSEQMFAVNLTQSTPWRINKRMLEILTEIEQSNVDIVNKKGSTLWYSTAKAPTPDHPEILDHQDTMGDTQEFKDALKHYKQLRVVEIETNLKRDSHWSSQHEALRIAHEYSKFPMIYFPHQVDFRGRIYPIPAILNPQSSDALRSLLEFGEGKLLTNDGGWWLAVGIAGTYGYDSVALNDRVEWVLKNYESLIKPVALDPIGTINLWGCADSPFQFIQGCIAYNDAVTAWSKGEDYYCHIPVQVDGKCNGLQHYSLITRDEEAAPEVGLVKTAVPGDIYKKVARMAFEIVKMDAANEYVGTGDDVKDAKAKELYDCANAWLAFGEIPRKIAKRPTMTFCYGSGRFGYRAQIDSELSSIPVNARPVGDVFKLSNYLAGVLDTALDHAINGASKAMNFLQECSSIYAKYEASNGTNGAMTWVTPCNFTVSQKYLGKTEKEIKIRLGSKRVKVKVYGKGEKLDTAKMSNAIAPNFVHSIDAAHLVKTLKICSDKGLSSFSLIHDSYGCHPSDMDVMVQSLKEAIIEIHSRNLLKEFRDDLANKLPSNLVEKLPEVPKFGSLDINSVLESDFLFA